MQKFLAISQTVNQTVAEIWRFFKMTAVRHLGFVG